MKNDKDNKKKKEKNIPEITVILLNEPSEEAIKNLNKAYLNFIKNKKPSDNENKSLV